MDKETRKGTAGVLAIIGSGAMAMIMADKAREMGVETHSFSNSDTDRVMGHSTQHHVIDIFKTDEIADICRKIHVDGVIATTELTVAIAAELSQKLGLDGLDPELSQKITDKGFVRDRSAVVTQLDHPWYTVSDTSDSCPEVPGFPVVVKPTALGGKRGVSVAKNRQELERAFAYAKEAQPASKHRIILEEYISGGTEYSVESLSCHGRHYVIQVTEKITSGPPHCVELGHMQPAELTPTMRRRVEEGITALLSTVGVDNTATHTEIKIVGDKLFLIELNARPGGDHIACPLTDLSTGYSYIKGAIQIAMGRFKAPDVANFTQKHCGMLYVVQQTKSLLPLFEVCQDKPWIYHKQQVTEKLTEIVHNNAYATNCFIYCDEKEVPAEIKEQVALIRKGY